MASIVRVGIARVVNNNALLSSKTVSECSKVGLRNIYSKTMQPCESLNRPKPFDYKNKSYNFLKSLYDHTSSRFDANSKIIVVEGPLASGKTAFAKRLAEELDMLYLPEANQDMLFYNSYGYDLRQLDPQVPESCRTFDVDNFMRTPKHFNTGSLQIKQYCVKFSQYIDALAHLFSTGQGVVLDRCVFSDFVFLEAMFNQGYVSRGVKSVYYELRKNTIPELLRPHLVIYLDMPVKKVIEHIRARKVPYEVNSPVVNPQYLGVLEQAYKQKYLKEISKHAELLIYDWSSGGDPEVVVEDIERINFDRYDKVQDTQMQDWVLHDEEDYAELRHKYADDKDNLMAFMNVPRYDVPELIISADDMITYDEVVDNAPGNEYEAGFDSNLGDGSPLFKLNGVRRDTLPVRERRAPT